MPRKTVLLAGYGTLAREFTRKFYEVLAGDYELLGALVLHVPADAAESGLTFHVDADEALAAAPDIVVEFAGVAAVGQYAERFLRAGSDFVVASVGALADACLLGELAEAARAGGSSLHVISGAVGGFDVLRTMALDPRTVFTIDNVKAPESLGGAPALEGRELSGEGVEEVFRGPADQAICGFPKNVNVAVASALAAGALDRAEVVITSVPGKTDNTHVIEASNPMVSARIEVSSSPDPDNPRSSTVTAWNAVALLANLASPVKFF